MHNSRFLANFTWQWQVSAVKVIDECTENTKVSDGGHGMERTLPPNRVAQISVGTMVQKELKTDWGRMLSQNKWQFIGDVTNKWKRGCNALLLWDKNCTRLSTRSTNKIKPDRYYLTQRVFGHLPGGNSKSLVKFAGHNCSSYLVLSLSCLIVMLFAIK